MPIPERWRAPQLDDATELLSRDGPENSPAYLRFYNADFADLQRATCYVDAGVPGPAVTILQSGVPATLPVSHGRDRGLYLARLGAARRQAICPTPPRTPRWGPWLRHAVLAPGTCSPSWGGWTPR